MERKVAVMAGTPVDTEMGMEYLRKKDRTLALLPLAVTPTPHQTHAFQLSDTENKRRYLTKLFEQAEKEGVRDFFIYCNSLCGAFDFESLARERGVRVYSPMQAYRDIGRQFSRFAVIAANNQSTAGIERSLSAHNPTLDVLGLGILPLVDAVEQRLAPEEIVRRFALAELADFFRRNGAECLILGCTHFPYFRQALERCTDLPLIDPADRMYERLVEMLG